MGCCMWLQCFWPCHFNSMYNEEIAGNYMKRRGSSINTMFMSCWIYCNVNKSVLQCNETLLLYTKSECS